jgi:predicted MFS family arabinose efflux permease
LQDAWFVSISQTNGVAYPATRAWGSFGFAVISVFNSWITRYTGTSSVFYISLMMIVPLVILCMRFPGREGEDAPQAKQKPRKLKPWILFRNYPFVTAMIMTVSLAGYAALVVPFYPFILENAGLSPDLFGLFSGYGAFVQVLCILAFNRWLRHIPLRWILLVGGVFGVAETALYGVATGFVTMFAASALWGVAMGINVTVLPMYIFSLVPKEYNATAMAFNGTVTMILTIVGNFIGGYAIASVGVESFILSVAVFRLALTALFAASIWAGKRFAWDKNLQHGK